MVGKRLLLPDLIKVPHLAPDDETASPMHAELVIDCACQIGNGPLWHPDEQQLYWLDIPQGRFYRLDPLAGAYEQFHQSRVTGGWAVQADGALLLFQQRCAVTLLRGLSETRLIDEIPSERETHFNAAIADPTGRVFAGTMGRDGIPSRLYRFETDGAVSRVLDGLGLVGGMGFTPDRTHLYVTDTQALKIYRFEYDQVSGELHHPQDFAEVPDAEGEGLPDGLTVDAEGGVWSARCGGGCVVHYSAEGVEAERIVVPIPHVTGVAFGGPDFDDLYITTAGGDDRSRNGPRAGALFRVHPGVNGLPEYRSQVLVDAGLG